MSFLLGRPAVKILLGLFFLVSAVLKFLAMDSFEIYIYSFHFFSLNASFMIARLAIILEVILGIGLISNTLHKVYWWGSLAMLTGYTLILLYALYIGRTDSCHCFGDFIQLDPKQSLIKNGVLIFIFLMIYNSEELETPLRWPFFFLNIMASTIAVFVISPPDNYTPNYDPEHVVQIELFEETLNQPPFVNMNLREGKKVLCFFSTSCEYCEMAARKLSLMQRFYGFPAKNITCVFVGTSLGVARFYKEVGSPAYRYILCDDIVKVLEIIDGNVPVIVFMENGEVVHEYGFRNMREDEIKAFFEEK
ncbi:MAG: hypothetical protein IKI09_08660 [Bacteroidales bacterium]|nr:hypothetical protein [Bacteroidales bacterium]